MVAVHTFDARNAAAENELPIGSIDAEGDLGPSLCKPVNLSLSEWCIDVNGREH